MKFTKISEDAFSSMQLNAGIVVTDFTPASGTLDPEDIIGATTGGITASCVPTYKDWGDGVDNCPKNTKELKKIDSWLAKMSGTFLSITAAMAKLLFGAATVAGEKVTPNADLASGDFSDIWFVGDYSDKNGPVNGGFVAVHLINGLSTGGFTLKSSDKDKGQFSFEFTGHYSTDDVSVVPFEVYVHAGAAEPSGSTETMGSGGE